MRKRIGHLPNGKIKDTDVYEKLQDYAREVVNKVCNEIAPEYDIIDLEGLFKSVLGYPFSIELLHYSAKINSENSGGNKNEKLD